MSGTIRGSRVDNSGIVGRPAGHVLQVKNHVVADGVLGTTSQNWPSTAIGFDNPILPSSDVLMFFAATFIDTVGGATHYVDVYFNGGGLGGGTGGRYVVNAEMYQNSGTSSARGNVSVHCIDPAPGSTTPTYNFYLMLGSLNITISRPIFTFLEIAR